MANLLIKLLNKTVPPKRKFDKIKGFQTDFAKPQGPTVIMLFESEIHRQT